MNDRSLLYATLTPDEDRVYRQAEQLARQQLEAGGTDPRAIERLAAVNAEAAVDRYRTNARLQRQEAQL